MPPIHAAGVHRAVDFDYTASYDYSVMSNYSPPQSYVTSGRYAAFPQAPAPPTSSYSYCVGPYAAPYPADLSAYTAFNLAAAGTTDSTSNAQHI